MSTTLGELRTKVLRLLGDPNGATYTSDLVLDGISAAHSACLQWCGQPKTYTVTGDGTTTLFALPSDRFTVEGCVVDDTGEILPLASVKPGDYIGANVANTNDWLEYPYGYLSLSKALSSGDTLTVYYIAQWSSLTSMTPNTTILEPPDFVIPGLTYYAAAYAMLPGVISNAEISQYDTRIDSGTPEHNPLYKVHQYFMQIFMNEMKNLPKMQRFTK